ncbi:pyridoxamine 5'-phosphate oxidase [Marinobacterium mangrovicola]|uniref:Pyridoxine/pyridoxamine 5'-phosphate oxidase n=1 Tax=Marinobacterium mangrovicola TaxID=1476959 RepID=A0A4R1GFN4_9GAMM|nr:pyridoxamine 5'-phosphate oxidase [Marinobacterium mangrovicola]TCK05703.1 pyridoxamine 5'-phosphate oxidase [Marinobacterium mangrovicola]
MANQNSDISALRREYVAEGLHKADLRDDPFEQFQSWFDKALVAHPDDATSMTLATADSEGRPGARIVLLKHFDNHGFCWFTDFRSEKGQHLAQNPYAEIMFYWYGLERQVRIRGPVEKLEYAFGERYFNARPLGSRLSAAVSHQSSPVDSRATLEKAVSEMSAAHEDGNIRCPETWGGYRLVPERFEFWQGRENRLHDRFVFSLDDGKWQVDRLQP